MMTPGGASAGLSFTRQKYGKFENNTSLSVAKRVFFGIKFVILQIRKNKRNIMNTIQFDARKATIARAVLNSTDDVLVAQMWNLLKESNLLPLPAKKEKQERKLGFLKGKVKFSIVGDGKITDEEFLAL